MHLGFLAKGAGALYGDESADLFFWPAIGGEGAGENKSWHEKKVG